MRCVDGFEVFFDEQYEGVVRSLTIVFGDRATAEDAAQAGFEKALRKWRHVAGLDRPGTWVYVVALRHGRRVLDREASQPSGNQLQDSPGPEPDVVSAAWVADTIATLPPRQRTAIVLRHLVGLRLGEIADALDISVGTVKSTLHAAHARLRVDLADADDHDDQEAVPDGR
jgi:RNA polymerase sigma-70 factor, ECF subfamily